MLKKHTMELFLSMAGDDMENIRRGTGKASSAIPMGREVVTDEDVMAVCAVQVTNRIFEDGVGYCETGSPERRWTPMKIF